MDKEKYLASVKESLEKSMVSATIGYAQFPERLRPVVEKMEKYWYFKPPSGKSKQYSFWIMSCDEILDGCAEFGVNLLDELYKDWRAYMDTHGGVAPFPINSPKSLVNTVSGKAALLRSGNKAPMWQLGTVKQSRLDV